MCAFQVLPVTTANARSFVAYCRAHGGEHDESYLPQEGFAPTAEYPAYLLVSDQAVTRDTTTAESVLGAACLIRGPSYARLRIARFMILHAMEPSRPAYSALLSALAPHLVDLDYAFGFIPEHLTSVRQIWEEVGLRVERYAYVLEHPGTVARPVDVPDGYRFEQLYAPDQEALAVVCKLLNLGFAGHPQRAEATPERLAHDISGPSWQPGGLMLLWGPSGQPVATVWVERDDVPGAAAIGGVVVHPDYRGRGLGHLLIRQALHIAHGQRLHPVYLSVSAGNEPAIRLYASEGFRKTKAMVCYRWRPALTSNQG